ncbi:hypothetical protein [Flexivirga sp.]|uniref:hypothetical protein n=1 Tax=Flexivirga sp. TaxID=1962927 RepID=UPI003F7E4F7B
MRFLGWWRSLDCSRLGAVCVAAAGIELVPGQDPCTISPGAVLLVANGFTRPAYATTPDAPR